MRRLLTGPLEPGDAGASLQVIAAFDDCLSDGGTLLDLTMLAAGLLDRGVSVRDELNDRMIACEPTGDVVLAGTIATRAMAGRIAAEAGRGRQATEVTVDSAALLAATLDHAGGRLGVVWAERPGPDTLVLDELILERLARAAATRILHDHEQARPSEPGRADALERLLAGDLSPDMFSPLCRRARIDPAVRRRVAVLVGRPAGASPEVLLARARQAYGDAGDLVGCVVGRAAVLLVPDDEAALAPLQIAGETHEGGWHLAVGVSRPHELVDLPAALLEARRVIALSTAVNGGVERADSIGALLLLALVPAESLRSDEDVRRAERLLEPNKHRELAILETYCLTGSLRKTADQLYLHHSSVDYHVKRLEKELGFGVGSRTGQLRALLAIRLARLARAGLAAETQDRPTVVGESG